MPRQASLSCAYHTDQDREACLGMLDPLIAKFTELGLLDDAAYTRTTVTALRRRGLSERAVFARLAGKGIDAEMAREALDRQEDSDLTAALRLARRRRRGPYAAETGHPKNASEDRYKKDLAAFARAGYSYQTARQVLDLDREQADSILEAGRPIV